MCPVQSKKQTENSHEENKMVDLLDNDFKTTVLKLLKDLKGDLNKNRKAIYNQNENISLKRQKIQEGIKKKLWSLEIQTQK